MQKICMPEDTYGHMQVVGDAQASELNLSLSSIPIHPLTCFHSMK